MAVVHHCVCVLLLSVASALEEASVAGAVGGNITVPSLDKPAVQTSILHTTILPELKVTPPQKVPAPTEVEEPQFAAKLSKGTKGLNNTLLIAEPDAIKKDLGSRCKSDEDCSGLNNTYCNFGVCDCKGGFIPSKHSLDKCVKVPSGLGDSCQEEAQCNHAVPASECRDGKCACPPNFIFDGAARCWEKRILGGNCNITLQCDGIASALCIQGVCACDGTLIPSPENKCLQPAGREYPAPCEEDIQCSYSYGDEARCSNGQCKCTNNYHYNGTSCVSDKKLGEPCSTSEDCTVDAEGSRMCLQFECACSAGFSALPGEDICTKSAAAELAVPLAWLLSIVLARFYFA